MALPNIGLQNNFRGQNVGRRGNANESNNMQGILGGAQQASQPSKDSQLKKAGNQIVYSPDPNIPKKSETLPSKIDTSYLGRGGQGDRPNSSEKYNDMSDNMVYGFKKSPSGNLDGYGGGSEKQESLERMVNYLVDQINNFEKMLYNESRRNKSYFDTDRERFSKLETAFKLNEDSANAFNAELQNKLTLMEARIARDEKAKQDLRDRLAQAEETQREMLNYVKTLQKQENTEFLQMREILQEKLSEDQQTALKERERAKTLFHEVVRLGEQQERNSEVIQNLNLQLETKYQALEAKLLVADRTLAMLGQKGEIGLSNLSDWNEKMERKTQALESNLFALTREQIKDKETIAKLESINNRLSEDLSLLLNNLNTDYNQKLEAKVTELVNRIVMEHEERVKNHDDFKTQIELREQLNNERMTYEREEMREKYSTMDTLVRAEFQRKDEAIKTLHNILETQVRALQTGIKQEEMNRAAFENLIKGDLLKFQENLRKDLEVFKDDQTTTTEKLTEMIKIEIDTRLTSDIELKNHTNAIAQSLQQDVEAIKDHMDKQNLQFARELKEISSESAERANQLSRYIDQEVNNLNEAFAKKYEKLKVLFAKFGEQFKNHLLNTEAFRKEILIKTQELDQAMEIVKEEVQITLQNFDRKIDDRFKEERDYYDNLVETNNRTNEDKINKIKELLDSDVEILKEAIDNNRGIFMNNLGQVKELIETYHRNNAQNLLKIMSDIDLVRKGIEMVKSEVEKHSSQAAGDLVALRSYLEVELLNERTIRNTTISDLQDKTTNKINEINSTINLLKLADTRVERSLESLQQIYDERFNKFADQISDAFIKITTLDDNFEKLDEKVKEENLSITARMTTDHIMVESDTKLLFEELKRLTVIISKENTKTSSFSEKMTEYIINITNDLEEVRKKVEEDFVMVVDSKIMAGLERIRRENQDQWESTLKQVNSNFSDANKSTAQPTPADKFSQLSNLNDQYSKPTDDHNYSSNKDELANRLMEQHRNLKRDHQELIEKFNKLQISSEAELNIERGEHKKTILELTKTTKQNRELKQDIQQLQSKLILKDKEIDDLRVRLDAKNSLDHRLKERDLNLYSKNFGKTPTSTYDNKVVAVLRTYEEQKDKLLDENRTLKQELESYSRKLRESSAEKGTLKREYSQVGEKITKEILNRVTELENENTILLRDNEALREHIERINSELDSYKQESGTIRRKYDDLRQRFNILESSTPNKNHAIEFPGGGELIRLPKSMSTSKKASIIDLKKPEDEFASLKGYGDLNELSMLDMKKIMNEIMEIYHIKTAKDIVPSIKKTEKVLQAIPRLQKLINDISQVVLMKAGYSLETPQVELLCPILKKWAQDLDEFEDLVAFKDKLIELLQLSKDDGAVEIVKKVELILQSGPTPLNDTRGRSGKEVSDPKAVCDQFYKTFGVRPDINVFKNILQQLEDLKSFITVTKGILNLDPGLKNDATLNYAIRCIESARNPAVNIVSQIQEILECKVEDIIPRIESLMLKEPSIVQSEPDPYGLKGY